VTMEPLDLEPGLPRGFGISKTSGGGGGLEIRQTGPKIQDFVKKYSKNQTQLRPSC